MNNKFYMKKFMSSKGLFGVNDILKVKYIFIILAVVFLMGGVFAASISGMAVSVRENSAKSFSFAEKSFDISVSKDSVSGGADVVINGEKISGVEAGDVVTVDGAEVEVKEVKKPNLFRRNYQVELNVVESSRDNVLEGDVDLKSCTDSDGGLYWTVQGTVHGLEDPGVWDIWTDYCGVAGEETGKLVEYRCDKKEYGEKVLHECENGCSNGACTPNIISSNSCGCEDEATFQDHVYVLGKLFAKGNLIVESLSFFEDEATFNEDAHFYGKLFAYNNLILTDQSDLYFEDLTGTGNSYACIDSTGKLYRSSTACN